MPPISSRRDHLRDLAFFWPTPAGRWCRRLLAAGAIAAGLPPIAGAMALALPVRAWRLSSDYVIGVGAWHQRQGGGPA